MFLFAFESRLKQVEVRGSSLKLTTFKVFLLASRILALKQSLWSECCLHIIGLYLLCLSLISLFFTLSAIQQACILPALYLNWIVKNLRASWDFPKPPPSRKCGRVFMTNLSLRFEVCGSVNQFCYLQYLTGVLFTDSYWWLDDSGYCFDWLGQVFLIPSFFDSIS